MPVTELQHLAAMDIAKFLAMLGAILLMKVLAMLIGYAIVKLGYDALLRGVKGEFDFGGKVHGGVELKLLSASPGLFFVLFGSAVIIWALAVQKPVNFSTKHEASAEPPAHMSEPEAEKPE